MIQRLFACSLFACAFACAGTAAMAQDDSTEPPKPRKATDANFDSGTLFFVSTDDASGMKGSMDASDFGRFLAEPSVKAYVDAVTRGLRTEFERMAPPLPAREMDPAKPDGEAGDAMDGEAATPPEAADDWNPGLALVDLMNVMWSDAEGRAAASFGILMQKGFQPNLLMHVEGGEALGKSIDEFCAKSMENADLMDSVPVESLKIAGFEFRGIEPKNRAPIFGMVTSPDGMYFGRRGNEFVFGISRAGIAEYLQGSNPNSLGNSPVYSAAVKHAPSTAQSGRFFFNMRPLWDLLPMGAMFGGQEFQDLLTILEVTGLTELQGVYSTMSCSADGGSSRMFVGRKSKKGILGLVRSENTTVPGFVPVDVLGFKSMHVDYPKIAPLAEEIARAMVPGLQDSQIAEFRGSVQSELGVTVEEALGALTGETVAITFPTNAGAILMNPEAAVSLNLGMKVSNPDIIAKVFSTVGANLPASELNGRTVLTVPLGGMSMRVCHDGDWMFASVSEADLGRVLAVRSNADGPSLAKTAVFEKKLKTASGSVWYTNTAQSWASDMDFLGNAFLGAMMMPGVGETIVANPDLMYAMTATNLPKEDVLRKHFGPAVGTLKVSDDGYLLDFESLPPAMTPAVGGGMEKSPETGGATSAPKDM